jgi:hypothetical protein
MRNVRDRGDPFKCVYLTVLLLIPTLLTTLRSMGSRIGVHITFSFGLPGTVWYQL